MIWRKFQAPTSFCSAGSVVHKVSGRWDLLTRCLSAGQIPTGQTCLSATTSMKPASFNQPSRRGPGQGSKPLARETSRKILLKCLETCLGVREPSGEFHSKSRSMHSTQPPGLVFLVKYLLVDSFSRLYSCFETDASRTSSPFLPLMRR